jgi:Transposase zinc-ribbon domain
MKHLLPKRMGCKRSSRNLFYQRCREFVTGASVMLGNPKFTVMQFHEKYPDSDACLQQIFHNRYANQGICPDCGEKFSFYKVTNRKCYACAYCGRHVYPLANTIFHKSSTELKKWFFAIFLFSVSENGVSASELQRQLDVTYKCAYRMSRQIQKLLGVSINDRRRLRPGSSSPKSLQCAAFPRPWAPRSDEKFEPNPPTSIYRDALFEHPVDQAEEYKQENDTASLFHSAINEAWRLV